MPENSEAEFGREHQLLQAEEEGDAVNQASTLESMRSVNANDVDPGAAEECAAMDIDQRFQNLGDEIDRRLDRSDQSVKFLRRDVSKLCKQCLRLEPEWLAARLKRHIGLAKLIAEQWANAIEAMENIAKEASLTPDEDEALMNEELEPEPLPELDAPDAVSTEEELESETSSGSDDICDVDEAEDWEDF